MSGASHKRSIVVWDLPPAIPGGKAFAIKLGIKCEQHCHPDNWLLEVRDHRGTALASVAVGDGALTGTEALYGAELELTAPDAEGLFAFEVVAPAVAHASEGTAGVVHEPAVATFNVRTVPEADCRLTVVAIERESGKPVTGARVVVHPYRAVTDARGVADLDLPRGRYRLFVTGRDFSPLRLDGELGADTTIRAELELDLGPSDAELWA